MLKCYLINDHEHVSKDSKLLHTLVFQRYFLMQIQTFSVILERALLGSRTHDHYQCPREPSVGLQQLE